MTLKITERGCYLLALCHTYSLLCQGISNADLDILNVHKHLVEELAEPRQMSLDIYNLVLKPTPQLFTALCNRHQHLHSAQTSTTSLLDIVFTGLVDLSHTRQIFSYQRFAASHVMILTRYEGSYFIGCDNTAAVLKVFTKIRLTPGITYYLYTMPRMILEACPRKIQIALALPQLSNMTTKTSGRASGVSIKVIANFVSTERTHSLDSNDDIFIERFENALQQSAGEPPLSNDMILPLNVKKKVLRSRASFSSEKERLRTLKRTGPSNSLVTCSLNTTYLNASQIIPMFQNTGGNADQLTPLTRSVQFNKCVGICFGVNPNTQLSRPPLVQQAQHEEFYLTNMKLASLNLSDWLPPLCCIGYNYKPSQVSFMYVSSEPDNHIAVLHQEYILSPTQCACL